MVIPAAGTLAEEPVALKPPGPLHVYTVPPFPVKLIAWPIQTGLLLAMFGVGKAFTVPPTVAEAVQVFAVTITVYRPFIAIVELLRLGFCCVLVKPPGPLQLYDVPPPLVNTNGAPIHTGPPVATFTTGNATTDTLATAVFVQPDAPVTVTV